MFASFKILNFSWHELNYISLAYLKKIMNVIIEEPSRQKKIHRSMFKAKKQGVPKGIEEYKLRHLSSSGWTRTLGEPSVLAGPMHRFYNKLVLTLKSQLCAFGWLCWHHFLQKQPRIQALDGRMRNQRANAKFCTLKCGLREPQRRSGAFAGF